MDETCKQCGKVIETSTKKFLKIFVHTLVMNNGQNLIILLIVSVQYVEERCI